MVGDDFLAGLALGSLGGYAYGKNPYQEWEAFINKVGDRIGHLAFYKIVIPQGLFTKLPLAQDWYGEGVRAFVYGLPNASMPLLFKCLELGLRKKYEEIEKKPSDGVDSNTLINWAEGHLKDKHDLAHGFRLLRNLLHKEYSVKEQEVAQAIYNITVMINILYPYMMAKVRFTCRTCKKDGEISCLADQNFIGNIILVNCVNCRTSINLRIFV